MVVRSKVAPPQAFVLRQREPGAHPTGISTLLWLYEASWIFHVTQSYPNGVRLPRCRGSGRCATRPHGQHPHLMCGCAGFVKLHFLLRRLA